MPDFSPKRVALLGSTGSIGTQALEVIRAQPGRFAVVALSAHSNAGLLVQQAREFRPAAVVIGDEAQYATVKAALAGQGVAITYESEVAGPVADGRLVRVLTDWCPSFPGCYLYHPSRRQTPPALTALTRYV